jgi:signal transduction histidine kinase
LLHIDRRSLRFRLLAWLGGVALVVVGVTWLLHGMLLRDLARGFLGERLQQEAEHALRQFHQGHLLPPLWLDENSPALEVFHHLYVLELDGGVTTSHPRWLVPLLPYLEGEDDTLVEVVWQERHLLVYRKVFEFEGNSGVLLIGEDYGQVESGLQRLHWWVASIAGLVLGLLILLNLVAVNRGLRPLSRLQRQLDELRSGGRERLRLDTPSELDGLVSQLNRFLDEHERRVKRSRESVANLSHALKTPLAAITQALRGSRPIDAQRRRKMLLRLEDMHAQLEAELRRSRIAGPQMGQYTRIQHESERLVEMFTALYPDRRFQLDVAYSVPANVSIERQDFAEMLGIVLDNAGKWANSTVMCRVQKETNLSIQVEDDGPGVAPSEIGRLGQRGYRLDEGLPGHGLGLSILQQLVKQYSGRVRFQASSLGGLQVEITLPVS